MLYIPTQRGSREEKMDMFTPEKVKEFSKNRDLTLEFYNLETKRPKEYLEKPSQISIMHNSFNSDLQEAFSMMDFVCGKDINRYVEEFQMGLGFQLRKQHSLFWYDFAEVIIQEMLNQIKEYNTQHKFKFSSLLPYMFLHQNPNFFRNRMGLGIFDENGVRRLVYVWTPLLFATYDYYAFLQCFLTPILQDCSEDGKLYQLFVEQTRWMQSLHSPCVLFLGEDFTFIRLHGSTKDPF